MPRDGAPDVIKYIGSKRTLIPAILDVVGRLDGVETVVDLFSGTARVGHALKRAGYRVLASDHNAYASTLARCYVQADAEDMLARAEPLIRELNALPGRPGYFTETFCLRSRFVQPKNGERVDAVREAIASGGYESELEAVLLVSLMEAADRVDSTTGVQMAYLKQWAARSSNDLQLRVPDLLARSCYGKGQAYELDAFEAAERLTGDVAYLDPPYNQHSYLGNYHVWESLIRWDKPEVFGVACKRVDCRERQSAFNSRLGFAGAMRRLLASVQAPVLIVSFSDEGFLRHEELEAMLGELWEGRARIITLETDYRRYVGAKIGIYNRNGVRVGKVGHLRNKERLYVASARDLPRSLEELSTGTPFATR